jgi:hypothetical protein
MRSRRRLPPRPWRVLALVMAVTAVAGGAASGCTSADGPRLGEQQAGTRATDPDEPLDPTELPEPNDPLDPGELPEARAVVVNGVGLDDGALDALESELGWAVADGVYWYDPVLGAVGLDGQATAGFLPAGLLLGGPLTEDASAGTTGVFVNGRELPADDLAALEDLFAGPIPPDRYFLDAAGYYGYEGAAPLGNVFATIEQQQQQSGGGAVTETAGGWIGGDGDDSYYFDPESGCSVMAGDGVSC